jgi:hypothetical protein
MTRKRLLDLVAGAAIGASFICATLAAWPAQAQMNRTGDLYVPQVGMPLGGPNGYNPYPYQAQPNYYNGGPVPYQRPGYMAPPAFTGSCCQTIQGYRR